MKILTATVYRYHSKINDLSDRSDFIESIDYEVGCFRSNTVDAAKDIFTKYVDEENKRQYEERGISKFVIQEDIQNFNELDIGSNGFCKYLDIHLDKL